MTEIVSPVVHRRSSYFVGDELSCVLEIHLFSTHRTVDGAQCQTAKRVASRSVLVYQFQDLLFDLWRHRDLLRTASDMRAPFDDRFRCTFDEHLARGGSFRRSGDERRHRFSITGEFQGELLAVLLTDDGVRRHGQVLRRETRFVRIEDVHLLYQDGQRGFCRLADFLEDLLRL